MSYDSFLGIRNLLEFTLTAMIPITVSVTRAHTSDCPTIACRQVFFHQISGFTPLSLGQTPNNDRTTTFVPHTWNRYRVRDPQRFTTTESQQAVYSNSNSNRKHKTQTCISERAQAV